MAACEKCWADAYMRSIGSGKSQSDCYYELLEERKNNPCTPQEQAGDYWDEEKQCDRREVEP
jgi:hypothetical protein